MKNFIKSPHVGFLCINFVSSNEWIRLGIDKRWLQTGKKILTQIRGALTEEFGPLYPLSTLDLQDELAQLVVMAATDPSRHLTLPTLASALMLAHGKPCLLVEADRSSQRVSKVSEICKSPKEADKWIDNLEASHGRTAFRVKVKSDSSYEVAIPLFPSHPPVSAEDLEHALPFNLAEALASKLASPELREELDRVLAQGEAAGSPIRQ